MQQHRMSTRLITAVGGSLLLASTFVSGVVVPASATGGPVDVLFLFDTTGSMGGALSEAKSQVSGSIAKIRADYADSRFGVAAVADYAPDVPWALTSPLTADVAAVQSAIDPLSASGGGDSPEAYTRALYEAAEDSAVGWRAEAKRLVVLVNDDVPHDNDLNEGVPTEIVSFGSPWNTGVDPGRDGVSGTSDDLDWQGTLQHLKESGIVFASVLYSGDSSYLPYWEWWTKQTGGVTRVGGDGTPLGDTLVTVIFEGVSGGDLVVPAGTTAFPVDSNGDGTIVMASLGDSYQSGEGLLKRLGSTDRYLEYDCGTDLEKGWYVSGTNVQTVNSVLPYTFLFWEAEYCQTKNNSREEPSGNWGRWPRVQYENKCHRAGTAYPMRLQRALGVTDADGMFVACSGAKTANVGTPNAGAKTDPNKPQYSKPGSPEGVAGGELQYKNLQDFATGHGSPDVITIGIGGNNIGSQAGLSELVKSCIAGPLGDWCGTPEGRENVLWRIRNWVAPKVKNTVSDLVTAHPDSTVIVFGYPSVVTTNTNSTCVNTLDQTKRRWVNDEVLPALNRTLKDAVQKADALPGSGHVVYQDVTAATKGHEACVKGQTEWVNGVLGQDVGASFHPNQLGHKAIAEYLEQEYIHKGASQKYFCDPNCNGVTGG